MNSKYFQELLINLKDRSSPCIFVEWNNIKKINSNSRIGKGFFGTVFQVTISNFSKPLAMKVIDVNDNTTNLNKERISREIQLLYSCCHPNILPLYGITFNEQENLIGLITPLKWGNLAKVIDNLYKGESNNLPREFNNEMKQKVIFGITAGLYYLSSNNIIHRDIKLENILLDEDFNPFICDFGLAKEISTYEDLNQSEWGIGTLPYLAPELFLSKVSNTKIDIYAWAIVVNSIIEGSPPYEELFNSSDFTPFQMSSLISKGQRPSMVKDDKFKFYQDLIEKAWKNNFEERPSAEDILKELMKKEANLEGVNIENLNQYQMEILKATPDFLVQYNKEKEEEINLEIIKKYKMELKEQKDENKKTKGKNTTT